MKKIWSMKEEIISLSEKVKKYSNGAQLVVDKETGEEIFLDKSGFQVEMESNIFETYKDIMAANAIALHSETIIIPSELVFQLIDVSRNLDPKSVVWKLPFPYLCVQFSGIVREKKFFPYVEPSYQKDNFGFVNDNVVGMLMFEQEGYYKNDKKLNGAIAYFASTSFNRITWFDETGDFNSDIEPNEANEIQVANKLQLQKFASALTLFFNSKNVLVEPKYPSRHIQRKAKKEGRKPVEPYYICVIKKTEYEKTEHTGKGTPHGHMYKVAGHFRRYKTGKSIWINTHYRGLAHAENGVIPKIYTVDKYAGKVIDSIERDT